MENGIVKPMLRSLLISYVLSGILLAALAFALYKLRLKEGQVNLMVYAVYLLTCLSGGFLAGKRIDEVNKMAELGTQLAHVDGGVPNLRVSVPSLNEYYLGQLIYFFEKACGISGYLLEVNPFNQPGVEAYKKNMFALLNKPGYEKESEAIQARLKK